MRFGFFKTAALSLVLSLSVCSCSAKSETDPTYGGTNITIALSEEQDRRYFTWQSDSGEPEKVTLYESNEKGALKKKVAEYTAEPDSKKPDRDGYYTYRVKTGSIDTNGKMYAYTIGSDELGTTKSYLLKTPAAEDGAYSCIFVGDAQIGDNSEKDSVKGWQTSLKKIGEYGFDDAEFIISAGDQVDDGDNDAQYDDLFLPEELRTYPFMLIPGNHDGYSKNFSKYFTLPNVDTYSEDAGEYGSDYWYPYDGTLFIGINTGVREADVHDAFIGKAIDEYKAKYGEPSWVIVNMHFGLFTAGRHSGDGTIVKMRESLADVFSKHSVDLVLNGHDHIYTRSFMMDGTEPLTDASSYEATDRDTYAAIKAPDDRLVLYVTANSSSGGKFYDYYDEKLDYAAWAKQNYIANISKIDVTNDKLTITTYESDAESTVNDIVDTFTIYK